MAFFYLLQNKSQWLIGDFEVKVYFGKSKFREKMLIL